VGVNFVCVVYLPAFIQGTIKAALIKAMAMAHESIYSVHYI